MQLGCVQQSTRVSECFVSLSACELKLQAAQHILQLLAEAGDKVEASTQCEC